MLIIILDLSFDCLIFGTVWPYWPFAVMSHLGPIDICPLMKIEIFWNLWTKIVIHKKKKLSYVHICIKMLLVVRHKLEYDLLENISNILNYINLLSISPPSLHLTMRSTFSANIHFISNHWSCNVQSSDFHLLHQPDPITFKCSDQYNATFLHINDYVLNASIFNGIKWILIIWIHSQFTLADNMVLNSICSLCGY